jgi:hypothetical protein
MTSPETLAYQQSFAKTHSEFVEAARGVISQTAAEVFADATGPALNEPHVIWPQVGTGRQRTTLLHIWVECGKLRFSWLTCIAMAD